MGKSGLQLYQAQFHASGECVKAIADMEQRFKYTNEIDYFSNLVNFSSAKKDPYQRWVRYREGYSTALVEELLRRAHISAETHFIADPMVGSGSTIVAANRNGYDAFGVDVNPFCKVIVDAKMMRPTKVTMDCIDRFLQGLGSLESTPSKIEIPLAEYFPERNLHALVALKHRIQKVGNAEAREILLACWYFIIEDCSNRKKDGNGLATRPSPVTDVVEHFCHSMQELISDYTNHPFTGDTSSAIFTGSACDFASHSNKFSMQTGGKKLGAIIFSPPYANSFDYYESYKMELLFGQLLSPDDYQVQKNSKFEIIEFATEKNCIPNILLSRCSATRFEKKYPKKKPAPVNAMAEHG